MSIAPSSIELRPLSLGEILDRTAQLYRSHFLLFVGIAIFPRALILVWQLIQAGTTRVLIARGVPATAFIFGATLVAALLYFTFAGIGLAATNRAVSAIYLGRAATIAGSYKQVKPHWLRYILTMFLSTLYAWGPTLVPYIAMFAVIGLNGKKFTAASAPGATKLAAVAIVAVMGLALLGTVPYGVWATLRYAMAVPASIFEDIGARASIKRSIFLTKNGRGRLFVMILMLGIVFWIVLAAVEVPFMVPVFRAAVRQQQPPLWAEVGTQGMSFLVYSIVGPVYGIAITLFYYDERIRKEGFDIEWMMEGARLNGAEVPVPPVPIDVPSLLEPERRDSGPRDPQGPRPV